VIFASDKTLLTIGSGDNSAWPIYLTIGNLEKAKRRSPKANGLILLGILPKIPKKPREHTTKRSWHNAVRKILAPLEIAGRDGIELKCADGFTRLAFPRIACWIADYPEMCLLTMVKQKWCPRCECPPDELGTLTGSEYSTRDSQRYASMDAESLAAVGYWKLDFEPFYKNHPDCNIHLAVGPDRLHQLLKGILKDHIFSWVLAWLKEQGKPQSEVDRRFASVPRFTNLRSFGHKFTETEQWTGVEYKALLKVRHENWFF
jgi:hypothetical protein